MKTATKKTTSSGFSSDLKSKRALLIKKIKELNAELDAISESKEMDVFIEELTEDSAFKKHYNHICRIKDLAIDIDIVVPIKVAIHIEELSIDTNDRFYIEPKYVLLDEYDPYDDFDPRSRNNFALIKKEAEKYIDEMNGNMEKIMGIANAIAKKRGIKLTRKYKDLIIDYVNP